MVTECFEYTLYLRQILELCTDGRWGVLEPARGAEQHITEAAPNELKLGEGG